VQLQRLASIYGTATIEIFVGTSPVTTEGCLVSLLSTNKYVVLILAFGLNYLAAMYSEKTNAK
jgi:hypothetical protein